MLSAALPGRILPPLLASALFWWPAASAHAQTNDGRHNAALENGVDSSIAPGDDFFGYANGGWLKHTEIPAGRDRWTARTEIEAITRQQVAKLLEDASS